MAHGNFVVCIAEPQEGSDGFDFKTISWGYENAEDAFKKIPKLATEKGANEEDLVVIRLYTPDEFQK